MQVNSKIIVDIHLDVEEVNRINKCISTKDGNQLIGFIETLIKRAFDMGYQYDRDGKKYEHHHT